MISCKTVGSIVQPKLEKIELQILALQNQKAKLIYLVNQCQGDCIATFEESYDVNFRKFQRDDIL